MFSSLNFVVIKDIDVGRKRRDPSGNSKFAIVEDKVFILYFLIIWIEFNITAKEHIFFIDVVLAIRQELCEGESLIFLEFFIELDYIT